MMKYPEGGICEECKKKAAKLSPVDIQGAVQVTKEPLYINSPQAVDPRYLWWTGFIDVMETLKSMYQIVHVLNLAQFESSSFMRNLFTFIKERDIFKYGMLYLECRQFTNAISLLFQLYFMLVTSLKIPSEVVQPYSLNTISQALIKLFRDHFPQKNTEEFRRAQTIEDEDMLSKEWCFTIFLDTVYFHSELCKRDFILQLNALTADQQNINIVFSGVQPFDGLKNGRYSRLQHLSNFDAFKLVEHTYNSIYNDKTAAVWSQNFMNQVVTPKNVVLLDNETSEGSFLWDRTLELVHWKESLPPRPCK